VIFGGLAAWRAWSGDTGTLTWTLGLAGIGLGVAGLVVPRALQGVFLVWMVVAFPIGWVVSRVMLGALFFLVFTPVAFVFRLMGRDVLHRRKPAGASYWVPKPPVTEARQYFRQF
jgi:hypothetical protein